jgi:hypothetical protein
LLPPGPPPPPRSLAQSCSHTGAPSTTAYLLPGTSWFWHFEQVKHLRWYALPDAAHRMTNSLAGIVRPQAPHDPLEPNILWREREKKKKKKKTDTLVTFFIQHNKSIFQALIIL